MRPFMSNSTSDSADPNIAAKLDEIAQALRQLLGQREAELPEPPRPQMVTLDQAASMVHRSKRTLERYRGQMPEPAQRGRRGQPHLYDWSVIRTWLEKKFGVIMPERFPGRSI